MDIEELKKAVGDIPVIEDACQAMAVVSAERKPGVWELQAHLVFIRQNLDGYGDGRAIATNSDEIAETLMRLRMYGMTDKIILSIMV